MTPTQGKCKDCKYFNIDNGVGWCLNLDDEVKPWWTGCVQFIFKEGK